MADVDQSTQCFEFDIDAFEHYIATETNGVLPSAAQPAAAQLVPFSPEVVIDIPADAGAGPAPQQQPPYDQKLSEMDLLKTELQNMLKVMATWSFDDKTFYRKIVEEVNDLGMHGAIYLSEIESIFGNPTFENVHGFDLRQFETDLSNYLVRYNQVLGIVERIHDARKRPTRTPSDPEYKKTRKLDADDENGDDTEIDE